MSSPPFPNIWHLRTVAEASAKSCMICHKPTTAVLITPDQKDFFYACRGHLKDRGFCSPIVDEADAAAKQKKEALQKEIEAIKKEYEEKLKKKREARGKDKNKEKEKAADQEQQQDEKERDDKIQAATEKQGGGAAPASAVDDLPRIYALHRNFYQMRLDRLRNAELARRNRERLNNPASFPAVPSGDPA